MKESQSMMAFYRRIAEEGGSYDAAGMREMLNVKPEEVKKELNLAPDEMLLGFRSTRFIPTREEMVIAKLNTQTSIRLLTIGIARTGKTATSARIVNQLTDKLGIKFLGIDSAGEMYTHKYPFGIYESKARQEMLKAWFAQIGERPKGYDAPVVSPAFLGETENVDVRYALSYLDFKELSKRVPLKAKSILEELLGIQNDYGNSRLLARARANPAISTWEMVITEMRRLRRMTKDMTEEQRLETTRVGTVFQAFAELTEGDAPYLSDDPRLHMNPLELLRMHEGLIFQGQIRTVKDDDIQTTRYNAFIKMLLAQVVEGDVIPYQRGATDCYITDPNGIVIWMPEVDSLINKEGNSTLKTDVSQLITKYGKYKIHTVFDVQYTSRIDDSVFKNSIILSSRADNENYQVLKDRGVGGLEIFKGLAVKKPTSIGTTVSQFGFAPIDSNPIFFYAAPPRSQIFAEEYRNKIIGELLDQAERK